MKKSISQLAGFLLLSGLALLLSCDQIEAPYTENPGDRCGDATGPMKIRRVLLEDFTGHLCGNCPLGHEKIQDLKELYCDHLIPISIHSGNLTELLSDTGMYSYNFVTPAADSIREEFQVNSKPQGLINRSVYEGSRVLGVSKWDPAMDAQWQMAAQAELGIVSSYDAANNRFQGTIDIEFFQAFDEEISLSLYVVEDSIIKWQKNYFTDPSDIEFYVHRHVFRAAIGGAFGKKLAGKVSSGQQFSRSFSFVPDPEWNREHLSLVAFVSRVSTKEVIQASDHELAE